MNVIDFVSEPSQGKTRMHLIQMKIRDFLEFYTWADSISDPRTKNWPLVNDVRVPIGLLFAYILAVLTGPHLMKNKKAFNLQWIMVIYNGMMSLLNLYIFVEILLATTAAGYSYTCQEMVYSNDINELRIASALWWFYFSKIIEFLDTMFFILRKKNNQISFLHVYHHFSMVCLWWVGIKWVAGGQSFFSAMINAFIHIIMYAYYGLSAIPEMRIYLWWKKYLTQLQLTQFCTVMAHGVLSLWAKCRFFLWMQYALIGYMISFLILFSNFYLHAYLTRKQSCPNKDAMQANGETPFCPDKGAKQANGVDTPREEKKKK
ncbi:elongation of very long chain fatty acids protein 4 isoform X2 [Nematostella vectensis]|uniref:elongation of very long chain fatty acids protein 4 isoform X2 n=1 Tax=Nematostella vectensis TaxID=45351 RepID=UPI0020770E99|nr:elongation of very long chain fatty acids protein 4 isoform X2 [Nematostella vectensis]